MLLVIEEPETSVHPGAADAIVDVLKAASTQHQVLITTHSPEVLDAEGIGEANLRAVNWIDGATQIGSIPINARNALQQHLCRAGQLFRMQVLDAPDLFDEVSAAQITLFEEVG
jgi:predicted ATPase